MPENSSIIRNFVKNIPVYSQPKNNSILNLIKPVGTNLIGMLRQEQRAALNIDQRWQLFARNTCVRIGSILQVKFRTHKQPTGSVLTSFTGMLIAIRRHPSEPTIILRAMIDEVGVEQTFCIFSPLIERIEVVKAVQNVRHKGNKIYWIRERPDRIPSFFKIPSQSISPTDQDEE